jgi:predicted RNase H-like HicB family nuclease
MKQRFLVIYERGKRNFSGFAPEVPGCFSTGKTLPEMRRMMREALESHLQWMADDGDPIPAPKTKTVKLSEEDLSAKSAGHYLIVELLDVDMPAAPAVRRRMTA